MRRGEIYLVDLDPTGGSEASKVRPVIVVSNDAANRSAERNGRGVVTVVPVTSNVSRIYPFQVLISAGDGGLAVDSKAQTEQVRSIDYQRIQKLVGAVGGETLRAVDEALRTHLALSR